jgi:hypothetical protein
MLSLFLLIAALILFIVSAIGITSGKVNLLAAGLACWAASALLAHYSL